MHQHVARVLLGESARAHIKNLLRIHLPHRGSMSALHVVSINFQLRLGVDRGVIGEQQILVGLLGIRLVRALMSVDAPGKYTTRMIVEDAVEIFMTDTMRLGVIHHHVMINQLLTARQVKPV